MRAVPAQAPTYPNDFLSSYDGEQQNVPQLSLWVTFADVPRLNTAVAALSPFLPEGFIVHHD